jgi:hypothetical protein
MTVTAGFDMLGSILADTAEHRLHAIRTSLEISSPEPREAVAALVAAAERMCFVLDAIRRPHDVERHVILNGTPLV